MRAMISVTTARNGDSAELAEIAAATFPLACPPTAHRDDIAQCIEENLSAGRFADYLADPERLVLAARHTEAMIGYAMFVAGTAASAGGAPLPAGAVELSKLYVLPGYHRAGAAAALMNAGVSWASDRGAPAVWLGVNRANLRAQRFYRKNGFEVTGTRTFQLGSRLEDDFVMTRPLPVSP